MNHSKELPFQLSYRDLHSKVARKDLVSRIGGKLTPKRVVLAALGVAAVHTLAGLVGSGGDADASSTNYQDNYQGNSAGIVDKDKTILPQQENERFDVATYIKVADALLDAPNAQGTTFRDQMLMLGYEFGTHEPVGNLFAKAGKEGLFIRRLPTADPKIANEDTNKKTIEWGKQFTVSAFLVVQFKGYDGGTGGFLEVYGLTNPSRITELPKNDKDSTNAPNIVGDKLIEPGYVRIARIFPDGKIEPYAEILNDPGIRLEPPRQNKGLVI